MNVSPEGCWYWNDEVYPSRERTYSHSKALSSWGFSELPSRWDMYSFPGRVFQIFQDVSIAIEPPKLNIPPWSLTVHPWKVTETQLGSRLVFHPPTIFQWQSVKLQGCTGRTWQMEEILVPVEDFFVFKPEKSWAFQVPNLWLRRGRSYFQVNHVLDLHHQKRCLQRIVPVGAALLTPCYWTDPVVEDICVTIFKIYTYIYIWYVYLYSYFIKFSAYFFT